MEKKEYNVVLEEREGQNVLVFSFNSQEHIINLNSENQSDLRLVFYEIIKLTFIEIPEFKIIYDPASYNKQLFIEISTEYVQQLNAEILKIIEQKPILE
jgi:hypothetical protein